MKRTPIGYDGASALGGVLGVPEGSTWQSGNALVDETAAAPAVTAASGAEAGAHAASIDLHVATIPEGDASLASPASATLTDAVVVSNWASPPTQPAEAPLGEFDSIVAAALPHDGSADDRIDTTALVHSAPGIEAASFAPVASAAFAFTTAAPPLAPMLLANHATDSFGFFAPGAKVGADAIQQHGEFLDGDAHAAAGALASPAFASLPADFAMLANPPASLDRPVANGYVGSGGATAAQVQQGWMRAD
jgi:hypothetical protein